jgi:hypothetical protein
MRTLQRAACARSGFGYDINHNQSEAESRSTARG